LLGESPRGLALVQPSGELHVAVSLLVRQALQADGPALRGGETPAELADPLQVAIVLAPRLTQRVAQLVAAPVSSCEARQYQQQQKQQQ
jgi:hypothetical protein